MNSGAKLSPSSRVKFHNRGEAMSRLETFVDASFAFALTLLVISFDTIPQNMVELVGALKGIPAFGVSFALVIMLWLGHRKWSRRYGLEDGLSTIVSLILVFLVLIYVLPLRLMMTLAFDVSTGGWTTSNFEIKSIGEARMLMVIYGVGFASTCLCIAALNYQAYRLRDAMDLSAYEQQITKMTIGIWLIIAAAGVQGVLLAMWVPDNKLWIAGWSYALLSFIVPLYAIISSRKIRTEQKA